MAKKADDFRVIDSNGNFDVSDSFNSLAEAEKAIEDFGYGEYSEGEEVCILLVVKRGTISGRKTVVSWESWDKYNG